MAANPLVEILERTQNSLDRAAGFYKPRRRTLSGDKPRYPNIYGTARRPNPASAKVAQRRKKNVRFAEESARRRRQTPPGPLGLALGWAGGVLGAGSKELLEMFTGTARTGWETSKDLFDPDRIDPQGSRLRQARSLPRLITSLTVARQRQGQGQETLGLSGPYLPN